MRSSTVRCSSQQSLVMGRLSTASWFTVVRWYTTTTGRSSETLVLEPEGDAASMDGQFYVYPTRILRYGGLSCVGYMVGNVVDDHSADRFLSIARI